MGNLNPERMSETPSASKAAKLIRTVPRVTRKRYGAEQKIRIVIEEIWGAEPVSMELAVELSGKMS